jgi:hypothetical protein
MRNPIKPEVVPYAIRAVVAIVCLGAYALYGKPLDQSTVSDAVNMLAALFLGKELMPRAGEGK